MVKGLQMERVTKIACIGAGYVGGPTMAKIAQKCPEITVTVVDISEKRIKAWNSNDLPIYEPGLKEVILEVRDKNLFFSTNIEKAVKEAEMIFVAVNTPTKEYGEGAGEATDMKYWMETAKSICKYSYNSNDKIIVEKSTVPVGTAEMFNEVLRRHNKHFPVLSNPEFLAEGTAMEDLENPDRILIGGDHWNDKAANLLKDIYAHWVPEERILMTNIWSAELSKLAANAFLAQRVSSINSLAAICEKTGGDICEVSSCIGSDRRIGSKFLKAGPGFGGSCFKKDILNLIYICRSLGLHQEAEYWMSVIRMNEWQVKRIINRIYDIMQRSISGRKIAILGYSFKADTGDTRETPSRKIIAELLNERAIVSVSDPMSNQSACFDFGDEVTVYESEYDAVKDAEAIIVMTDWSKYKNLNWMKIYSLMSDSKMLFDCRNFLDHQYLANVGFEVYPVGLTRVFEEIPF